MIVIQMGQAGETSEASKDRRSLLKSKNSMERGLEKSKKQDVKAFGRLQEAKNSKRSYCMMCQVGEGEEH